MSRSQEDDATYARIDLGSLDAYSVTRYANMTFPAYRATLLRRLNTGKVVACGAQLAGRPVGLAMAEDVGRQDRVLRSIYVAPELRGRALATRLLSSIEDVCAARGWETLRAVFMEGPEKRTDLRGLIRKSAWSEPELRTHVVGLPLDRIQEASWMRRRRPLPPDFQVFPWKELKPEEEATLRDDQQKSGWPDPEVFPFYYGPRFEPHTSFGVRYRGRVVGWVVNHEYDERTLRFTCSFLREDLQKLGRLVELYARSVERMRSTTAFERGILTVPVRFPAMVAFARRHLMPFSDDVRATLGTRKTLRRGP